MYFEHFYIVTCPTELSKYILKTFKMSLLEQKGQ